MPANALLARYGDTGAGVSPAYVDAFAVSIPEHCTMTDYVQAFYSTWLFRLERFVLARAALRSTDTQLARLARREATAFAAWVVEARTPDQVLLSDVHGRTRSWLMCSTGPSQTTLWFGSAVTGRPGPGGAVALPWPYRVLLPLHRLYSRALLGAASRRLRKNAMPGGLG